MALTQHLHTRTHPYNYIIYSSITSSFTNAELDVFVRVPRVDSNSLDVTWTVQQGNQHVQLPQIQRVLITTTYMGPCLNTGILPQLVVLPTLSSDIYTIENLEVYSVYQVNVTVVTSTNFGSGIIGVMTTGTGMQNLLWFTNESLEVILWANLISLILFTYVIINTIRFVIISRHVIGGYNNFSAKLQHFQ